MTEKGRTYPASYWTSCLMRTGRVPGNASQPLPRMDARRQFAQANKFISRPGKESAAARLPETVAHGRRAKTGAPSAARVFAAMSGKKPTVCDSSP